MQPPSTTYEQKYWNNSLLVAGVDEAGRGALAGPVVAAAVILPLHTHTLHCDIHDSKILNLSQRERAFDIIQSSAISVGIGVATALEIDNINILQATFLAMQRALEFLQPLPKHVFIDGNRFIKNSLIPYTTIIKGDSICLSIACASIIAKVTRDRMMAEINTHYPQYGFASNKAYGTQAHRNALEKYGTTPEHRRTFLKFLRNTPPQNQLTIHDIV